MTRSFRAAMRLAFALLTAYCSLLTAKAQAPKTYTSSEILLGLQKLNTLGSVLYIAAHPDDENTRLLAYLANERHVETAYLSLTRGDGGQNLIGPELREQLGVIRTQELLAARRIDGAQQFFTRANDFGFSKTAEEALRVWDHEQVLADAVWVIRQRRPDVLITRFPPDARAGHGHHQASAVVAAEAFDAAGDPKRFPEQLQYVQPWQPKRLLWNTGSYFAKTGEDMSGYLKLDAGGYSPLLGQSYGELAARSRSQHRSQGMGSSATRGEATEYFQLVKSEPATKDIFDGVDLSWGALGKDGAAIEKSISEVIRQYDTARPAASVPGLLRLKEQFHSFPALSGQGMVWLSVKEAELNELIKQCLGLRLEATAFQPSVVADQSVDFSVELLNRSALAVDLQKVRYNFLSGDSVLNKPLVSGQPVTLRLRSCCERNTPNTAAFNYKNGTAPYWLKEVSTTGMYTVSSQLQRCQAENTPALYVVCTIKLNLPAPAAADKSKQPVPDYLTTFQFIVPIQYKHTDPVLGELYEPLVVVPPVLVNMPAGRAYVFADQQPKPVPVTVRAGAAGVSGTLALQVPAGWQVEPASVPFALKAKDEEQTVTFQLRPGAGIAEGRAELRAVATVDGTSYSRGIQRIEYPHIPTQTLFPEAVAPLVRLTVARGHTRTVGYLMGAGDEVPEALRQLGYTVTLLDANADLTLERLRRFDAVVLGIRAYNTVEQLKTRQPELLKYVEAGGTLLVQYVVPRGTVVPQIGPYPLTLSGNRITVENTPVTFLTPTLPVLTEPNKLAPADFATNWVQEQGLYYPSAWDARYQPVLASHDPGEADQQSAILVAPYGKGRYIYTGLALFRQLPAGVPGAYRVLANLVESGGK